MNRQRARSVRPLAEPFTGSCGPKRARRGVTTLESAIVISVFLAILLGTLDLGLAVLKFNTLAEAARRLARSATVHGEKAAPESTSWGPATHSGTAADRTEYADAIKDILVVMRPEDVRIRIEWPDDDNRSGDRVRVQLDTNHDTIIPFVFGSRGLALNATSVMHIEH
jgi:hypothetical protein